MSVIHPCAIMHPCGHATFMADAAVRYTTQKRGYRKMGFLDSLLSKSAKKLVSEVAKTALDALSGESESSDANIKTVSVPAGYEALADTEPDTKIRAVLQKEFPQYEVRENVSPETLGGTGKFLPYSFGVYENGVPRLFIMVVYRNTCASRLYRFSKEEATKNSVPLINFVYAFENRIDYIIQRLHEYL